MCALQQQQRQRKRAFLLPAPAAFCDKTLGWLAIRRTNPDSRAESRQVFGTDANTKQTQQSTATTHHSNPYVHGATVAMWSPVRFPLLFSLKARGNTAHVFPRFPVPVTFRLPTRQQMHRKFENKAAWSKASTASADVSQRRPGAVGLTPLCSIIMLRPTEAAAAPLPCLQCV
jgi:hypothetical protein